MISIFDIIYPQEVQEYGGRTMVCAVPDILITHWFSDFAVNLAIVRVVCTEILLPVVVVLLLYFSSTGHSKSLACCALFSCAPLESVRDALY